MAWVVSAVIAAVEIGSAALIATAVMEVGIAMTVVGTVTKSKELTKIGGVLSMAGGVASLAIGAAGALGGAAAAGEAGVAEGAAVGAYSDVAGEQFAQAAAENAAGTVASSGLEAAASGAQSFGISDPGGGFMDSMGGKMSDSVASPISSGFDAKLPPVGGIDAPALAPQAAAPPVSGTASAAPVDNSSMLNADASGHDLVSQPLGGSDAAIPKPGMFEDPKAWFKNLTPDAQSRVSTALLQAGGQAVGGIFAGWSEEQKLALAQQSQDLLKQRVDTANTNASYVPTIAFKPVAPKGLIAGAQGVK
jgi:hypothetical protein